MYPKNLFFYLVWYAGTANALVLEELTPDQRTRLLSNKTIGCYASSFDPVHKGQEAAVHAALQQGCDYVLMLPDWEGGTSSKKRTPVGLRTQMLMTLYKDHPQVILTQLNPQQLQALLTRPDPKRLVYRFPTVQTSIPGVTYVGILGYDTALWYAKNRIYRGTLMQGIQIPDKYKEHTKIVFAAFPAKKLLIVPRKGYKPDLLPTEINDMSLTMLPVEKVDYSPKAIIADIKAGRTVDDALSTSIIQLIQKEKLYQQPSL